MSKGRELRCIQRSYTLSADVIYRFESLVPAGKRSELVEALMDREVERLRREALREKIDLGLTHERELNAEVASEWACTMSDRWNQE